MGMYVNEGILISSKKGREKVETDMTLIRKLIDLYIATSEKALTKIKAAMIEVQKAPNKFNFKEANKHLNELSDVTTEMMEKFKDIKGSYGGNVFTNMGKKEFWNRADIKKLSAENEEFANFVKNCREGGTYYNKILKLNDLYSKMAKESREGFTKLYKDHPKQLLSKEQVYAIDRFVKLAQQLDKDECAVGGDVAWVASIKIKESYLGAYLESVVLD